MSRKKSKISRKSKKALKSIGVVVYFLILIGLVVGYYNYYGWEALLENAWTWVIMFFFVIPIATFVIIRVFGKVLGVK